MSSPLNPLNQFSGHLPPEHVKKQEETKKETEVIIKETEVIIQNEAYVQNESELEREFNSLIHRYYFAIRITDGRAIGFIETERTKLVNFVGAHPEFEARLPEIYNPNLDSLRKFTDVIKCPLKSEDLAEIMKTIQQYDAGRKV